MLRMIGLPVALAFSLILAACVSAPPPPEPTVAHITFVTAPDANPDPAGRASPTVVFVYALQPGAPFQTAPADQMLGGTLTDDSMKRVARMVIVPGKTVKKIFTLPDGASGVGVAVAYRAIDTAKWRDQASVTPNQVTLVTANVGSNEITVQ